MKKTNRIMAAIMAAAMLPAGSIPMIGNAADSGLWEKFLKYDLCITDYAALTPEQKELCHYIFDTEQSTEETIRCERARRTLAGDTHIGERVTLEQLQTAEGIWDNYSDDKQGWQYYIHCVPDIRHLDGDGVYPKDTFYDEYWLDDEGNEKVMFAPGWECFKLSDGSEIQIDSMIGTSGIDIRMNPEYRERHGYIEKNGGFYYIKPDNTAVFAADVCLYTGTEPESTTFTVESEINGCPVTAVEHAALGSTAYTEIVLPDTLKIIDHNAFSNCDTLEKINFPAELEYIGACAFVQSGIKDVDIDCPSLNIGKAAFSSCEVQKLNVNAPYIGENAFMGCHSLSEVTLGEKVDTIAVRAFAQCDGVESMELSDTLRVLGQGAFDGFTIFTHIYDGVGGVKVNYTLEIMGAVPMPRGHYYGSGIEHGPSHPLTDKEICIFDKDCAVTGYKGTEAERYAAEWGLNFTALETETGDVNLDGQVSVADAVTLLRHLLGRYTSTGAAYGDMNGDSSVDSFDMVSMRNKIVSE